ITVSMLANHTSVYMRAAILELKVGQVVVCLAGAESAPKPWVLLDHRPGLLPGTFARAKCALLRLPLEYIHVKNRLRTVQLRGFALPRHEKDCSKRQSDPSADSFCQKPILA